MSTKPDMEEFFTRQQANDGIEFPLSRPDGTPTDHRIRIRSVDSDAFRAAEADSGRRLLEISLEKDKAKANSEFLEEKLKLRAALVVSWTFDRPCTPESVREFLREAPQIADQIDRLANQRSRFFKRGSDNSTPSPAPSST